MTPKIVDTDMTVSVTPSAATRALEILRETGSDIVFRIAIKGGGCSGLQYDFLLDIKREDDIELSEGMVTDHVSMQYLDGSIVNFKNEIFSQMFVVENPQVTQTCGCGSSFAI
jgi:iron-sulfur cluster insertion protein